MKELFLILLFGRVVLLTPEPISFNDTYSLIPSKPLSVVTRGAALEIKITSMVDRSLVRKAAFDSHAVTRIFPPGILVAYLKDKNGDISKLTYSGNSAVSSDDIWLVLTKPGGISTRKEFIQVVLTTKKPMRNVAVQWRNYKY